MAEEAANLKLPSSRTKFRCRNHSSTVLTSCAITKCRYHDAVVSQKYSWARGAARLVPAGGFNDQKDWYGTSVEHDLGSAQLGLLSRFTGSVDRSAVVSCHTPRHEPSAAFCHDRIAGASGKRAKRRRIDNLRVGRDGEKYSALTTRDYCH